MHNEFLVQLWLGTEVLRTLSSIWLGFELMTSRSWQCIAWPRDHSTISDFEEKENVLPHCLRGLRWFQMHGLSDKLMHWQLNIFSITIQDRRTQQTDINTVKCSCNFPPSLVACWDVHLFISLFLVFTCSLIHASKIQPNLTLKSW